MLLLSELRAREGTGLCPWGPSFYDMPVFDFHLSLTTDQQALSEPSGAEQKHLAQTLPSGKLRNYQICLQIPKESVTSLLYPLIFRKKLFSLLTWDPRFPSRPRVKAPKVL